MNDATRIPAAIILCGGHSFRMGTDKANIRFGVETLLGRACRIAFGVADHVIVVAANGQRLPPLPEHSIVTRDEFPDAGPLGGLLTGLRCLHGQLSAADFETACVWVTSCDTPFVGGEFICTLYEQLGKFDAICVQTDSRMNPLSAVYRAQCLVALERLFLSGERKAMSLLDTVNTKVVSPLDVSKDPGGRFLMNVNTPELLAEALDILAQSSNRYS